MLNPILHPSASSKSNILSFCGELYRIFTLLLLFPSHLATGRDLSRSQIRFIAENPAESQPREGELSPRPCAFELRR
ncbi:hypothetical protein BDV11DRAFT_116814 [Aspergillus similis]